LAMRPEVGRAAVSKRISHLGDILSKMSSPSDSLVALTEASDLMSGILAEAGNATDHISGDDAELLGSVVTLVEKTIYSSMDDAHQADVAELDAAIQTASRCNADIDHRQSPEGDLGVLHQAVQDKQTELNRLQGVVDEKTEANNTAYEQFDTHNQMIAPAPACPGLPARTMPALDVFFAESEYVIWYTAQQAAYTVVRDAFVAADSALDAAILAYHIQKAVRDVQYCDWRSELEAACVAFDVCFSEASEFYTGTLVPRVTSSMNGRIEIKKAGDTLIHQIQFLLGEVEDQETPEVDTSRYEIEFPELPAKGLCDLSPLEADEWVPSIACEADDCEFTAHNDGRADGIFVTGAGSGRWNGCYGRAGPSEEVPIADDVTYRNQNHNGAIYQLNGVWRIADFEANYTAYQVPGVRSQSVPSQGWAAGLDARTPAGEGEEPAPSTHEVFACAFTAHNDGNPDGIIVTGAGTLRWNGCYNRAGPSEEVPIADSATYRHQAHNGAIYRQRSSGVWRIADFEANYTAYQVPGVRSQSVPSQGWAAGLDDRTPAGQGEEPAPSTRAVIA